MPVPDFQTIMLPMLKISGDGKEHTVHDFLEVLSREFNLGQAELNEFLQRVFGQRKPPHTGHPRLSVRLISAS